MHAHIHTMTMAKTTVKFQKDWLEKVMVRKSCAHNTYTMKGMCCIKKLTKMHIFILLVTPALTREA